MSDFLDNLLTRSNNPIATIQPRPISLFEPLSGTSWSEYPVPQSIREAEGGNLIPDLWAFDAIETIQPADNHPPAVPLAIRPGTEQKDSDTVPIWTDKRTEPSAPQQLTASATHRPDPIKAETLRARPVPGPRNFSPVALLHVQPEPVWKADLNPPAQTDAGRAARLASPSHPARGNELPAVVENVMQSAPKPTIERTVIEQIIPQTIPTGRQPKPERRTPTTVAIPQSRSATPLPVVARPQVRPYPEPNPVASPVTKPEPTIQVTIGRIEVRAAVATSLPKKQAPSAPMLSLDDYLRRRNGEAR